MADIIEPVHLIERGFVEHITNDERLLYADTDSFVGSSIINIDGKEITVKDFYDQTDSAEKIIKENNFIKDVKDSNTLSVSKDIKLENKKIKYVMKHLVKKRFFKIRIGKDEVEITEDHSLIVLRDNKLISISPKGIKSNDRLFKIQRKA